MIIKIKNKGLKMKKKCSCCKGVGFILQESPVPPYPDLKIYCNRCPKGKRLSKIFLEEFVIRDKERQEKFAEIIDDLPF